MTGLQYLVRHPRLRVDDPTDLVVFLHNRGSNMHAFAGLADAIGLERNVFVFPNGPFMRSQSSDDEGRTYAWQGADESEPAARGSRTRELLGALFADLERNFPTARVIIGGFSQGAACALGYALESVTPIAGIIALSPSRLPGDEARLHRWASHGPVPIFLAHGTRDRVVPIEVARHYRQLLLTCGHPLTYLEYPIAHDVSLPEVRDLRRWLARAAPAQM